MVGNFPAVEEVDEEIMLSLMSLGWDDNEERLTKKLTEGKGFFFSFFLFYLIL